MMFSDETLSAFIDGELPEVEVKAIREAMVQDGALSIRIENLRKPDALIAAAYGAIDAEPIPDSILDVLEQRRESAGDKILEFRKRARPVLPVNFSRWRAPLAATVALMVGVAAGIALSNGDRTDYVLAGLLDEESELALALNVTLSGDTRLISGGSTFSPVLSFQSGEGVACREFTISTRSQGQRAVACRQDGHWDIVIAMNDASLANEGYATASSGVGVQFDAFVEAAVEGAILSADEERQLIRSDWTLRQ